MGQESGGGFDYAYFQIVKKNTRPGLASNHFVESNAYSRKYCYLRTERNDENFRDETKLFSKKRLSTFPAQLIDTRLITLSFVITFRQNDPTGFIKTEMFRGSSKNCINTEGNSERNTLASLERERRISNWSPRPFFKCSFL